MFKERDLQQLKVRAIDIKDAEQQITFLKKGFPHLRLTKAATLGHGIKKLTDKQIADYINIYENAENFSRVKFVPASGAATRMFKALYEFDELFRQSNFDSKVLNKDAYKHVKECFDRIHDFAFYQDLDKFLAKEGTSIEKAIKNNDHHIVLSLLLGKDGLGYGEKPKGLIIFHRNGNDIRTSLEEHLVEGAGYAANKANRVSIHLTVSPEHKANFEAFLSRVLKNYELQFKVTYDIGFSVQKPSTDTPALDDKGEPFRESDGSLHLRPGGHGALLANLNDIDADLIFIKNIDNVTTDKRKQDTYTYKKALAGLLIEYQQKIFSYLKKLEKPGEITAELIKEISVFLSEEAGTVPNKKQMADPEKVVEYLRKKLNRPIRVCGMVKNEGEPGGGPFWALNSDGAVSLQIVESSQVDRHNPEQEATLNSSTHFNPVDIVCGIKDYKGNKFNLLLYRDPNTGFISKKFKNGRALKALEMPGLWNGSMADWNTIFVEVPASTFTPVKTLHDLLRPVHQ